MNLSKGLSPQQLKLILSTKKAKYLSQHDITRHYIINYNNDSTFTIETFQNNKKLGEGNGKYYILANNKDEAILNVNYISVFESPNKDSPFSKKNSFYPKLKDYTIGPFYGIIPDVDTNWLPIFYKHLIEGRSFKVLNFYNKLL